MIYSSWPQTGEMLEAFSREIADMGGAVTESFDDGKRLYVRSTLPGLREVRPGDNVQGGVAMRATETEIRVHPYILRIVCVNGAIRAETTQTRIIEREQPLGDPVTILRDAVRACAEPAAFERSADEMHSVLRAEANFALALMPFLKSLPPDEGERLFDSFLREFHHSRDHNGFGLMNAVTATARETRDPEMRWRLEALGGGIGALLKPMERVRRPSAKRVSEDLAGMVG